MKGREEDGQVGLRYGLLPKQIENAFLNERSNSFHLLLIQLVYI